jgi:hypothetical protein
VPDLSRSVQFDWDRKEVVGFDRWMDLIRQRRSQATGEIKTELSADVCPGQPNLEWLSRSALADYHLTRRYGKNYKAWKP